MHIKSNVNRIDIFYSEMISLVSDMIYTISL